MLIPLHSNIIPLHEIHQKNAPNIRRHSFIAGVHVQLCAQLKTSSPITVIRNEIDQ